MPRTDPVNPHSSSVTRRFSCTERTFPLPALPSASLPIPQRYTPAIQLFPISAFQLSSFSAFFSPVLKLVIQISRGLIRDQTARRQLMFYSILGALVMLFLGSAMLFPWLRQNPILFIIYWALCGWVTVIAMLLAIFDLLIVRTTARRERKRLEQEFIRRHNPSSPDDPQPPGA